MRKLVHRSFLKRNSQWGIERYLSKFGIDVKGGFRVEASDRKNFVYLVADEPEKHVVTMVKDEDRLVEFFRGIGGIPGYVAELLIEAGYDTVAKVKGATDAELMEINGIAQHRVDAIRRILGTI